MPDRKTEPRKRPRQARSRVLYDALVEATQQLLASEGLEGVTTNRVAERAGVSIGSLYQYFPSREALIAAVIERKLEQDLIELTPFVQSLHHVDLDEALAGLLEVPVRYYRDETPLYRAMVAALTEVERDALVRGAIAQLDGVIVSVLAPHADRLVPRHETCAWIIRETLIACVRAAAAEHPDALADGSLARQLETMLRALVIAPET